MKLAIAFIALVALSGCAATGAPGSAAPSVPSVQAQWYAVCKRWSVAQPQVATKMLTAPIAQVQAALPISQAISQACEAPMPADAAAATTQLTSEITQVIVIFGLQQITQGATTK